MEARLEFFVFPKINIIFEKSSEDNSYLLKRVNSSLFLALPAQVNVCQ